MASYSSRSSLDSSDNEGPIPIQLDASNAQVGKPSVLRRLSNATTGFFSLNSEPTSTGAHDGREYSSSHVYPRSGVPHEGLDHVDYFGADHIHRSLTGRSNRDEEMVEDAELETVFLEDYSPQGVSADVDDTPGQQVRRRESTVAAAIQTVSKKLGFWDDDFTSQRIAIVVTLVSNYFYLIIGFTCALCIYWGAYYKRVPRYMDLKIAVVVADAQVGSLTPILGKIVTTFFNSTFADAFGKYDILNYSQISTLAASHNNTIEQEVLRQVHHQHYLAAYYVHVNATAQMYEALVSRNTTFNPATDLLSVYYETGSDYNAMTNSISNILQTVCQAFSVSMKSGPWSSFWMNVMEGGELQQILAEAPILLTGLPNFVITDKLPVVESVVQAPLQIGLIYLCVFTFFQFLFSMPIHMAVASKIKGLSFVAFRIATAQGSYFVLSLSYVVLNTAFGISFTTAFGNSGFLVIWAIAFLTMSSIGSIIEIMVLICVVLKPAMIGVCLLLVAVLNLAPTISPIYLCPSFYRYGYAMPVYNSYHLLQVAYFNSWKGHMGRHIGILIAWMMSTNAMMPFAMKWVSKKMQEKKMAAAANAASKTTAEAATKSQPPVTSPTGAAMVSSAERIENQSST